MAEADLNSVEALLQTQDEVMTRTRGISMRPLLRQGRDIVVIQKPQFPLKPGDVPLYKVRSKKELVLHRILKVQGNTYIIRGDNTYALEHVPQKNIVGVMKAFYREGKYCDCEKSRSYRIYVFLNRISYPFRFVWKRKLRPVLGRCKRFAKRLICGKK